jgi:hypothetical protein
MRILLPLVILLSATACSESPANEHPATEQLPEQAALPPEPQLPGTSELKGALIGSCPKIAMRLTSATCTEPDEGGQSTCTYTLRQDEADHSAKITTEGVDEGWKLVDVPQECSAAA